MNTALTVLLLLLTRARAGACHSTTRLVLVTKDGATAGDPNEFSTTGTAVFPTGYLYETGYDAPNVLNFRYLPRRLDSTTRLQYQNEFSLKVGRGGPSYVYVYVGSSLACLAPPFPFPRLLTT